MLAANAPLIAAIGTIAGAAGALLGVVITVAGHHLNGGRQRKSERTNALFDRKLNLYVKLMVAINDQIDAIAGSRGYFQAGTKQIGILREVLEAQTEFNKIRGQVFDDDGKVREGLDAETLQNARTVSERALAALEEKESFEKSDGVTPEGAERVKAKLEESKDQIIALGPELLLISEDRLGSEFSLLVRKVTSGVPVEKKHLNRLQRAARTELGIKKKRVRSLFFSIGMKTRYAVFKFQTRKEKPIQEIIPPALADGLQIHVSEGSVSAEKPAPTASPVENSG